MNSTELILDGRGMTVSMVKNGTVGTITWTLPPQKVAYAGAVVLLSPQKLTMAEQPIDGTRYMASTVYGTPNPTDGMIGGAQVVAAFYGYFGDDIDQLTVDVTGLDANTIYYASVHAASGILQYYKKGVQSYVVETTKNNIYTGSIERHDQAWRDDPANQIPGKVYYDVNDGAVYVWIEDASSEGGGWSKAGDNIMTSNGQPSIDIASIFNIRGLEDLWFFNGVEWEAADGSNMRTRMRDGAWQPFQGIIPVGSYPADGLPGQFVCIDMKASVAAPTTSYIKYCDDVYIAGEQPKYANPSPTNVQVWINGQWVAIKPFSYNSHIGQSELPTIPEVGDFFYNKTTRKLLTWVGSTWVEANTSQEGDPSTIKLDVGTDGTDEAFKNLLKDVKTKLGYPKVCVELDEDHFILAGRNAIAKFRQRADNAYQQAFVPFTIIGGFTEGQDTYYLNDPRDGTDRIINILKIHRINQLGISSLSAETGLYAQAFYNQLYQGPNIDVTSIWLVSQLSELYEKIFAGNLMFTWNEARRELRLIRRSNLKSERVVLEAVLEKTAQELIKDRYAFNWLQDWAYAEAMEMLGQIRSKYTSGLASASGSLGLNGDLLLTRSTELKTELLRQLNDYEVGNGGAEWGAAFLIG